MAKAFKFTKEAILRVLPGTKGNKREIARRLGGTDAGLQLRLSRPDHADICQAIQDEREAWFATCEDALGKCVTQNKHWPTKLKACLSVLQSHRDARHRGYTNTQTLKLEGGETPVQVTSTQIPIADLPLPLRKSLLHHLRETRKSQSTPKVKVRRKTTKRPK